MTGTEIDHYPLQLTFGKRNLCHIETGEGAKVGQGVAICSVPRKHQALAEAMVWTFNEYYREASH